MEANKQLFHIVFDHTVSGLEWVEDDYGKPEFILRLCTPSIEEILAECNLCGYNTSKYNLKKIISEFVNRFSACKTSLGKNWHASEIFSGEIVDLYLHGNRHLEMIKTDNAGRFWITEDNAEDSLCGKFVDLMPETYLGEGQSLILNNQDETIETINFLIPTMPMKSFNAVLTPHLHYASCTDDLEEDIIIPFFDWWKNFHTQNKWMNISNLRAFCNKAEQAGIAAFSLWYLMNKIGTNHNRMYL